MGRQFYVQKTGVYVGNSLLWWKEGNNGYSPDIREARVFTEKDARAISSQPNSDKKMWAKEYIDKKIVHHIDMQDLTPSKP